MAYRSEQTDNSGNKTTVSRSRGLFRLTLTSIFTTVASGIIAYNSAAAASLPDTLDKVTLSLAVAAGTFVTAKVSKAVLGKAGLFIGAALGGSAGSVGGAGLGGLAGSKGEKVKGSVKGGVLGGAFGAATGAISLSVLGALAGFWGGAYFGHKYSSDAMMKYFFKKDVPAQKASAVSMQNPEPQFYIG